MTDGSNKENIIKRFFDRKDANPTVDSLYKLGLLALIPIVAVFFYLRTKSSIDILIEGGYMCSFRRLTGYYCPGCGGTRAAIYLARLHILDSLKMNAVVVVGAALYLYFMIKESLHRIFGTKGIKESHVYIMVGIFIATAIIRCIITNILIYKGMI